MAAKRWRAHEATVRLHRGADPYLARVSAFITYVAGPIELVGGALIAIGLFFGTTTALNPRTYFACRVDSIRTSGSVDQRPDCAMQPVRSVLRVAHMIATPISAGSGPVAHVSRVSWCNPTTYPRTCGSADLTRGRRGPMAAMQVSIRAPRTTQARDHVLVDRRGASGACVLLRTLAFPSPFPPSACAAPGACVAVAGGRSQVHDAPNLAKTASRRHPLRS